MNGTSAESHVSGRGRALAPALIVVAASFGGFSFGMLRQQSNGNLGLEIALSSLDFGEVWERTDFPWTLRIYNPTTQTVYVDSIQASCACTSAEPQKFDLAPGSSADVNLNIDFTMRKRSQASPELTSYAVDVFPIFRQEERKRPRKGWSLKGNVRHALTLSKKKLDLGAAPRLVQGAPMPWNAVTVWRVRPRGNLTAGKVSKNVPQPTT